jgi:hypothetical protein
MSNFKFPDELANRSVPATTSSYQAIGHIELIKYLIKKVEGKGFKVTGLQANSASGGNKMTGTLKLNVGNSTFGMVLGFRNSYDKSMSLGVGVGAVVFVCSNGMFHADVQRLRKHTSNLLIDLDEIVEEQLNYVEIQYQKFTTEVEKLQEKVLETEQVYNILGKLFFEEKLLGSKELNIIKDEMVKSDHFKMVGIEGGMTAWNLYNNITESLKETHPLKYFKAHAGAYNTILEYATI